jgi:glycosyltransferase involved in cell wall biosynthesis
MKSDVKVSIITPCFNSERTIRQTIESVLHQTYPNIEYIIVDGGSKDGTVSIIKEYTKAFNGRLRYVSEKDNGIYDAMNKGIKMSHGQLIGIINSDDYYERTAVEKVVGHYSYGHDQVIYGYVQVLKNEKPFYVCKDSHKNIQTNMIPHPTCFVSRNVYVKYGLFRTAFKLAADYDFMLRVHGKNVEFTQVDSVLAYFRMGGASDNNRIFLERETVRYIHKCMSFGTYFKSLLEYIFCMR